MHLPDDVAIRTSDHHGSQLATLYSLWGDWLEAMGDQHDELFAGMLDAVRLLPGEHVRLAAWLLPLSSS